MAVSDWSPTADYNTSIDGVNIAVGCPPSNVGKAIRAIMADVAAIMPAWAISFLSSDDAADALTNLGGATAGAIPAAVPSGAVFHFAANTAPTGYLECNGAAVSRTTYAALFAVVGTLYGSGDGSTTFNLPDLRGEFIRGWDHGRGIDGSRTFGTTQADAFQGHGHENTYQESGASGGGGTGEFLGANNTPGTAGNTGRIIDPTTLGANGTPRVAAETRPVNVALLPCIKV